MTQTSWLYAAERKLAEMESALQVVDHEIGGLEEQQTELLRQLKLVQEQISAARAKRVGPSLTLYTLSSVCFCACSFDKTCVSCNDDQR